MYKVTECGGSGKDKNKSFIFEEDGIYLDEKQVIEYCNIQQIILGKRNAISKETLRTTDCGFAFSLIHKDGTAFDFGTKSMSDRLAILMDVMSKLPKTRRNNKQKERLRGVKMHNEYEHRFLLDNGREDWWQTQEASALHTVDDDANDLMPHDRIHGVESQLTRYKIKWEMQEMLEKEGVVVRIIEMKEEMQEMLQKVKEIEAQKQDLQTTLDRERQKWIAERATIQGEFQRKIAEIEWAAAMEKKAVEEQRDGFRSELGVEREKREQDLIQFQSKIETKFESQKKEHRKIVIDLHKAFGHKMEEREAALTQLRSQLERSKAFNREKVQKLKKLQKRKHDRSGMESQRNDVRKGEISRSELTQLRAQLDAERDKREHDQFELESQRREFQRSLGMLKAFKTQNDELLKAVSLEKTKVGKLRAERYNLKEELQNMKARLGRLIK